MRTHRSRVHGSALRHGAVRHRATTVAARTDSVPRATQTGLMADTPRPSERHRSMPGGRVCGGAVSAQRARRRHLDRRGRGEERRRRRSRVPVSDRRRRESSACEEAVLVEREGRQGGCALLVVLFAPVDVDLPVVLVRGARPSAGPPSVVWRFGTSGSGFRLVLRVALVFRVVMGIAPVHVPMRRGTRLLRCGRCATGKCGNGRSRGRPCRRKISDRGRRCYDDRDRRCFDPGPLAVVLAQQVNQQVPPLPGGRAPQHERVSHQHEHGQRPPDGRGLRAAAVRASSRSHRPHRAGAQQAHAVAGDR